MNFDFSDDLKQLRDQARRFLSEQCTPAVVRRSLDEQETFAAPLWREIAVDRRALRQRARVRSKAT